MKSMVCPRCKGKLVTQDDEVYVCPYCDYQEVDFDVRNRRLELEAEKQKAENARLAKLQQERDEKRAQRTDKSGNTLIVHYSTVNPSVNMVVRLANSRQKDIMTDGQTLKFRLPPGQYVIVLKIGKINHNRTFIVPRSKEYVEITASWTGRPGIIVDQPEVEEELQASIGAQNQNAPNMAGAAPAAAGAVPNAPKPVQPVEAKPEKDWEDMTYLERIFRKKVIPQWIVAGVLLLMGLTEFMVSPFGAILMLLGAAIISPAVTEYASGMLGGLLGGGKRVPIKIACFVLGGVLALVGMIMAASKTPRPTMNTYGSVYNSTEPVSEAPQTSEVVTQIVVEDVTGKILSEAKKSLVDAGFTNIKEEPLTEIWLPDNWIVTKQSVEAGKKIDSNELIQLDCQKLDDYLADKYVGKNILEAEQFAKEDGFKLAYLNAKKKSLIGKVGSMDDSEKEKWIVKSATQNAWATETTVSLVIENESGDASVEEDEETIEEDEEAIEDAEKTETNSEKANLNQDEIRPEIKEAIDSYATFMDGYTEFMKKYQTSNSTELLMEYMDWMSKYADAVEKMEKLEGDLTEAEAIYYAEVMAKVSGKMIGYSLTL